MALTVHVFPSAQGWMVRRAGASDSAFPTQKEAISAARAIVRQSPRSQMIVYSKNGVIRGHLTHGLPKVQDPPHTDTASTRIGKAIGRWALARLADESHP